MKKQLSRILCLFLIFQMMLSVFAPVTVYANDATMLEPLIEPNTKTYKVEALSDTHGWFSGHYESKYINFDKYYHEMCKKGADASDFESDMSKNPNMCMSMDENISSDSNNIDGYSFFLKAEGYKLDTGSLTNDDSKMEEIMDDENNSFKDGKNDFTEGDGKSDFRVLSFPGVHGSGAKDVSTAETEYAIEIGNTLADSLNSILTMINGGKRYTSVSELVNKSILIRPTDAGYTIVDTQGEKSYIIVYSTLDGETGWTTVKNESSTQGTIPSGTFNAKTLANAGYPNADNSGNLLAYVLPISTKNSGTLSYSSAISNKDILWSEMSSFVYAMPKGYTKIDGIDNSLKFTNDKHQQFSYVKEGKESPWITIHQISMYANNAYKNHNMSMANKVSETETGNWFMTIIVDFFSILLNGLRSVLQLSEINTLVYNKGVRASSSYNYGAMSDNWWTVVLRYHLIFQSIAWFILICGFIKVLIDLNLSTVNPGKRMSIFETIQRFILCGFLLVTIIPIIQFMLNMNSSIVQIFASQADPNAAGAPVIGSLAGLVLQFAYFGIAVYINFTYIMRSIIIGILTVTAPFFISSMAFSNQNKGLFTNWFKELTANIFMQSVHAFSLAFLTNLITSGGGLESLVVSYSIIPLTELVRSLIFGSAGGATEALGKAAGNKFTTAAQSIGQAALNKGAGVALNKLSGGAETNSKGKVEEGSASGTAGAAGAGSGAGSRGASNMAKLAQAVEMRSDAAIGVAKAQEGNASGNQRLKSAASHLKKAGVQAGLGVMGGAMNLAMDMASMDMTGKNDFGGLGSQAVDIATSGAKSIGNAAAAGGQTIATGAGAVKAGAIAHSKAVKSGMNEQDVASARKAAVNSYMQGTPSNFLGTRRDYARGQQVSSFSSAVGGRFTSTGDDGVTETFSAENIDKLPEGSQKDDYNTYREALRAGPNSEKFKQLQNSGINVSGSPDGKISVHYNKNYMTNAGFVGMAASQDGSKVFVRQSGYDNLPRSYMAMIGGDNSKPQPQNNDNKQANPQ